MRDPVDFSAIHKICKLVVLLCFLHISVVFVFYVKSFDIGHAFIHKEPTFTRRNSTARPFPAGTNAVSTAEGLATTNHERNQGIFSDKQLPVAASQQTLELGKCPETSPLLVGPLQVEFKTPVSLEQVMKDNVRVRPGGRYTPRDCVALQKVAVIIPFRNRDEHLKFWLHYLHPILQRQQLDYGIYVINQGGTQTFNRAKLLNVGYMEALKDYDYGCFVFSDVDIIPMDDRNTYKCFDQPRHLSVSMDKFGFKLPYWQYFGGVSAMSKEQFKKINGLPNSYWGWGGEDDDIYNRLSMKGMTISRASGTVGKCRMIQHKRDNKNEPNPQRFNRLAHTRDTMAKDGINSLTYTVVGKEQRPLYTYITVEVGAP
ncbi:unnamed protein product [Arctogadus glacialis]